MLRFPSNLILAEDAAADQRIDELARVIAGSAEGDGCGLGDDQAIPPRNDIPQPFQTEANLDRLPRRIEGRPIDDLSNQSRPFAAGDEVRR